MNLTRRFQRAILFWRNQIIYRSILVAYGLIIVLFEGQSFPLYLYLLSSILYVVIQIALRNKKEFYCVLFDFIWILIVLWERPLSNVSHLLLLCYPLINHATFTLKHYGSFPVFCIFSVCFALLTFSVGAPVISYTVLSAILAVGIYLWYSGAARRSFREVHDVQEAIIDYYGSSRKPHFLYKTILDIVNRNTTLFQSIICLCTTDFKSYTLVNSSHFLLYYKPHFNNEEIENLRSGVPVTQVGRKYFISFPVTIEENPGFFYYVFVVNTASPVFIFNHSVPILELFFKGVAGILYASRLSSLKDHEQSKALLANMNYVSKAVNIMHFIRNRLTPIKVLVELTMDVPESIQGDKMQEVLKQYAIKANRDLGELLSRADYLLDPSNSPYDYTKTVIALDNFIFRIKSLWNLYYDDESFKTSIPDNFDLENHSIQISYQEFDLLISEILGNMDRHSNGNCCCKLAIEDKTLLLSFANSYSVPETVIERLVNDFNNDKREAIMFRKTHGVLNIKRLSEEMGIPIKADLIAEGSNSLFSITLNLAL